jgi:carboxymethylenebutenolidase
MCHSATDTSPIGGSSGIQEQYFVVPTNDANLPIFEAMPSTARRGNVLIFHDIWGANPFYQDVARRLAAEGYAAYLPDFFVREGPLPTQTREAAFDRASRLSWPRMIADVQFAVTALLGRNEGKIGSIGFCMGGTLVMLMATREPRIAAGVIYYGFPANPNPTENRPYEPLQEAEEVDQPLRGFWGDQDVGVGMDNVERYRQRLANAGKEHHFTIYPGLPHAFLTFDPDKPYYVESVDSWVRTLSFYESKLA